MIDIDKVENLKQLLDGKIQLNLLTQLITYEKENADLRDCWCDFVRQTNLNYKPFVEAVNYIAEENQYDSMKDYYLNLDIKTFKNNLNSLLNNIPVEHFGVEPGSIYCTITRKWFISAIARTFEPGCKINCILVLCHKDVGKLFSLMDERIFDWYLFLSPEREYFEVSDKNKLLPLYTSKFVWWTKLCRLSSLVLNNKISSKHKAFIHNTEDALKFSKKRKKWPRRSVLCGGTNKLPSRPKTELLIDNSLCFIPVLKRIPYFMLREEYKEEIHLRDSIWKAALDAYREGESWIVTDEEKEQLKSTILKDFK